MCKFPETLIVVQTTFAKKNVKKVFNEKNSANLIQKFLNYPIRIP